MTDIEEVNLPEPLKIKPSIAKYLDELEDEGKTIFSFAGASFVESLAYLFLLNKYTSKCIAFAGREKKHLYGRPFGLIINLKLRYSKEDENEFRKQFTNMSTIITNCIKRGEKTIIIPLGYERGKSGHANMLILRMDNKELEHFEPHGGEFKGSEKLQLSSQRLMTFFVGILNKELKKNHLPEVTYVEASKVCPYISGLQDIEGSSKLKKIGKLEPTGYCAAWSLFFAELCLKNPDIPSSELLDSIYNYLTIKDSGPDYLKRVIRGYAGYIIQKIDIYLSIFFKPDIRSKHIIDNPLSREAITVHEAIEILADIETYLVMNPDVNIKKELKKAMKEYRDLTKGKTKEEQIKLRRGLKGDRKIKDAYYRKRILQNYEEYKRVGRVTSEPIFESSQEIDRADIKNLNILEKGLLHEKINKENETMHQELMKHDWYKEMLKQKEDNKKIKSQTRKQMKESKYTIRKENTQKSKTKKNRLSQLILKDN